jgi:hypothetical protein
VAKAGETDRLTRNAVKSSTAANLEAWKYGMQPLSDGTWDAGVKSSTSIKNLWAVRAGSRHPENICCQWSSWRLFVARVLIIRSFFNAEVRFMGSFGTAT